jgi:4-amino-4-deoxy-L-arabinose transferase-like glycosyltransferase
LPIDPDHMTASQGRISAGGKRLFVRPAAVLLLLVALLAAANFFWLRANVTPPSWDQSAHISYCLDFHDLFKSWHPLQPARRSFLIRLMRVSNFWPPFFHLSTVPVTLLLGFSPDTVCATHILYLIVLAFSIYAIGRRFLTPWLGVAAAALTMLFPVIFGLSRTQLVDLPLTAMVTLVQALILKTGAGTRRKSAWMLGLAAGLCVLTKWTGPVFFAGTFLLVLVRAWKKKEASRVSMILSLLVVALLAFLIIMPWFRSNWTDFTSRMGSINTADAARMGSPKPFTPQAFSWYAAELTRNLLTWPLMPFILLGAVGTVIWSRKGRLLAFLACWFVPAFLVFVGIPVKDDRFIVPFLPAFALLTVAGIGAIPRTILRKTAWAALFFVAGLQFFMYSFGWPVRKDYIFSSPPSAEHWPIREMLDEVNGAFGPQPLTIAILPSLPYFNASVFQYFNKIGKYPFQIRDLGIEPVTRPIIDVCDLLILKNELLTIPGTEMYREQFFATLKQPNGPDFGYFDWKHFRLPDQTDAYIFVKKKLLK